MKKKERQNKDMKEMEKGREGVQKPSQREQLGSKESSIYLLGGRV